MNDSLAQLDPAKAEAVRTALLAWFRASARDLPWRRTCDPYAIWLSEILLQQTRVDQGLPYYERFIAAFPTVEALAAAGEDAVLKLWEGLGYYSRARHLLRAAQQIVGEGGGLPATAADWEKLPGVGPYTARAIASIAYDEAVPVVDGNVKRVLARLFDIEACIDDTATGHALWTLAEALLAAEAPGDFNQAMMELGATVCTPRQPRCASCPLETHCQARAADTVAGRPVRRAKKAVPHKEMIVAVLNRQRRYLIGRRPAGLLGGLWELPCGEVHPGETHQDALTRFGKEDLDVVLVPGGLLASVHHAYSHFKVTLNAYRCTLEKGGAPRSGFYTDLKWVSRGEFRNYAFPGAQRKFLGQIPD